MYLVVFFNVSLNSFVYLMAFLAASVVVWTTEQTVFILSLFYFVRLFGPFLQLPTETETDFFSIRREKNEKQNTVEVECTYIHFVY